MDYGPEQCGNPLCFCAEEETLIDIKLTERGSNFPMRKIVLALGLLLLTISCDEAPPTAPTPQGNVNVTVTQTVNLGTPLPNGTPAPTTPGATDKVITGLTVTEIGGDGARTFAVNETALITATPRNKDGVDPCIGFPTLSACGAYTEQDILWFPGTGIVTDCTSTTGIVCDLGTSETNYNRKFRTLRAGTFTYQAQFKTLSPVAFTGTVLVSGATAE